MVISRTPAITNVAGVAVLVIFLIGSLQNIQAPQPAATTSTRPLILLVVPLPRLTTVATGWSIATVCSKTQCVALLPVMSIWYIWHSRHRIVSLQALAILGTLQLDQPMCDCSQKLRESADGPLSCDACLPAWLFYTHCLITYTYFMHFVHYLIMQCVVWVGRLEAYDRNQNFNNILVEVPAATDIDWPVSSLHFTSLQ